ncbi:MAG: RNA methyltransferase [Bdellovibrionota bacterium]
MCAEKVAGKPVDAELLEQFMLPSRIARIDQVAAARTNMLTVVLDGVQNHHNVSAVIRSADAFGIQSVHLIGEQFDYSRGITLGTERWMDLRRHATAQAALSALSSEGYTFVVTAPEDDQRTGSTGAVSVPIYALPFQEKLALVFGNENRGVSSELFDAARYHAFIPMVGFVESLNISVACAISLFCSMIAVSGGDRRVATVSADEQRTLRERWLKTGVRNSDAILREIGRRSETGK